MLLRGFFVNFYIYKYINISNLTITKNPRVSILFIDLLI